ncbi:MAG: hypothetical protein KGL39_32555 [Patescibacteria group bacterium]|nr:hypothetical protein [Patescibacteria group bacterium]
MAKRSPRSNEPPAFGDPPAVRKQVGESRIAPDRGSEDAGWSGGVIRDAREDFQERARGQQAYSDAPLVSTMDHALGDKSHVEPYDPAKKPEGHSIFRRQ